MSAYLTKIKDALSGTPGLVIASAVTSASISAYVTWTVASKRIEAEYAKKIDDELEATRKFYATLNEKPSIEEVVKSAGLEPVVEPVDELIEKYAGQQVVADPRPPLTLHTAARDTAMVAYNRIDPKPTPNDEVGVQVEFPEPQTRNVFDREGVVSDHVPQELVDARDADKPYIISLDEFTEGEAGQDTFTYYADDGVLADSQDMPVDNVENMVGEDHLSMFGVGSGDSRVVYVRNEKIGMDFEIVLHDGNYGQIVHGITPEG